MEHWKCKRGTHIYYFFVRQITKVKTRYHYELYKVNAKSFAALLQIRLSMLIKICMVES